MAKIPTPNTIKTARAWGKMGFVALTAGAIGETHPELIHGAEGYVAGLGERLGEDYHRAGGSWEPEDFRDFCLRRVAELHQVVA